MHNLLVETERDRKNINRKKFHCSFYRIEFLPVLGKESELNKLDPCTALKYIHVSHFLREWCNIPM